MTFLLIILIPVQSQGLSDLPGQRQARGPPLPKGGHQHQEQRALHGALMGAGWELGTAPNPVLWSFALPWLSLGERRSNARLLTGGSWQSSVLQTRCFSRQLLRVVPGGSCYFYIKAHFLLIICMLYLENHIQPSGNLILIKQASCQSGPSLVSCVLQCLVLVKQHRRFISPGVVNIAQFLSRC